MPDAVCFPVSLETGIKPLPVNYSEISLKGLIKKKTLNPFRFSEKETKTFFWFSDVRISFFNSVFGFAMCVFREYMWQEGIISKLLTFFCSLPPPAAMDCVVLGHVNSKLTLP